MTDPSRPYYVPVGNEEAVFGAAHRQGLALVLKGPTGCGKTRFVEAMAHDLGRPLITVSCHDDLTAADLVGRFLLEGGDTKWVDGPLTRAVREGAICYLDEVVEARQDTTVVIHPLADHRRQLPIDRLGIVLDAAPGFTLVVSYNPGYQSVLKDLKDSTRQRMVAIELDFPPADVEERVVCHEAGIGPDQAARLVQLANAIRRVEHAGLREVASTRVLIAAGLLVAAGLPLLDAARAAVAGPLTDDPTVLAGLHEMIANYLADGPGATNGGDVVAYESDAEPIKMGYLMDFRLPDGFPEERRADLTDPFEHVFQEGLEQGVIDRPVEIIYREVEGLPKGSVKAVIDAYGELVEEGCLLIFGPSITDNAEPTKEAIEERFRVPAISVTGSEEWLGEWTFSLSMGSMSDEPIFWADLIAKQGIDNVGVLVEQSLVGESYVQQLRRACRSKGIRIVAEEQIPQTAKDVTEQVKRLHDAGVDGVVHCGFGFGVVLVGFAMEALGWDPPRFMGTAFQNAWLNEIVWNAMVGWTGIDQYDAENQVGQEFLDRYAARFGRRPEWCVPVVNRDLAVVCLQAFAEARPLSPAGVREALERVKMFPAASGAPGTRISFGKYMHRGWMGPGYLVARQLDPDGVHARTVDRFGEA